MDFQVLATRGHDGYRQYRIPAMAVTPAGRIIAIYDARVDLDDLPGPVDLVIRTSDDYGDTWSSQKIFLESNGVSGYGDASIIIDPTVGKKGRIIVFCQASHLASFFESSLGSDENDPKVVHISLSISDDDGQSWSHKIVTHQVKDSQTQGIFATSGMGGRIAAGPHQGRLIHSFVLRRADKLLSALAYSDDHGITWRLGAEIPNGNETAVVALPDGRILFHSRQTPNRLSGYSYDGGITITNVGPHPELPDPSDNGSLCLLKSGEVICTHNHDSDLRRRTTIKKSRDGGITWPEAVVLESDSSAYSTACELADGRIAVLFERHGYTELVFCRVAQTEFRPTESSLSIEKDERDIGFDVILRYIRPGRNEIELSKLSYTTQRRIPKVDMSVYCASERKEIGPQSGSASGDPLFTKSEFDQILGPVSPGLHLGDEIRFSGRLTNYSNQTLRNLKVYGAGESLEIHQTKLETGEKAVFLDVRYTVTGTDLDRGEVSVPFTWQVELMNSEILSGEINKRISTITGLQLK